MPIDECPTCTAPMPARAVYCPRCGRRCVDSAPQHSSPPAAGPPLAVAWVVYSVVLAVGVGIHRLAALEGATIVAGIGLVMSTLGVIGMLSLWVETGKRRRQRLHRD